MLSTGIHAAVCLDFQELAVCCVRQGVARGMRLVAALEISHQNSRCGRFYSSSSSTWYLLYLHNNNSTTTRSYSST